MEKFNINQFDPCEEAVIFYDSYKTTEEAWNECNRGDWMLWIAFKLDVDLRLLTRAKALCALTVIHLMKDERSPEACKIALRFAEGEATKIELNDAAAAAYAADADYYDVCRKNQKQTADICRKVLTEEVFERIETWK